MPCGQISTKLNILGEAFVRIWNNIFKLYVEMLSLESVLAYWSSRSPKMTHSCCLYLYQYIIIMTKNIVTCTHLKLSIKLSSRLGCLSLDISYFRSCIKSNNGSIWKIIIITKELTEKTIMLFLLTRCDPTWYEGWKNNWLMEPYVGHFCNMFVVTPYSCHI